MADGVKLVAPDGGWGWMVVFGMSLSNVIIIPILQNFGLLFRDVFFVLDMSVQESSSIINTNSAFGYVLGVFNGPILRNLGFRKVAVIGGLMMFIGLFVTSFASSFLLFFIFYGLIHSLGIGWSMSSFHLALSTYFVKRRGMAMGIAMTVTGLGPVFMPLVISWLMEYFGPRGAALLLSGVVLHCVFCGLLLQPVKWHRKKIEVIEATAQEEEEVMLKNLNADARGDKQTAVEIDSAQNGKSIEAEAKEKGGVKEQGKNLLQKPDEEKNCEKKKANSEAWYQTISRVLDLDLLKDPAFLSMCVGMSLALAADMNFSLMLPMIMRDYDFGVHETAVLQSVVGSADILSRFITPFIINKIKLSARVAYLLSLIGLIISRFWLTLTSRYLQIAAIVAFFGASKGVRSVFMPLVIPNYVPLEKLPSAQGLQNVMHGLFLMVLGPVVGYVRDRSGNYELCIHILNTLTALTIMLWTVEFVYMRAHKKNTFVDVINVER